jgi:Rrf2 family protein
MKITTKGCYGLRAMVELAHGFGGPPLLMREIAEKHDISRKYLHALLTSLRLSGLVRSVRGSGGGYVLARAPSRIRLSEVLRSLEGSLSFAECVSQPGVCERRSGCPSHRLWSDLSRAIEQHLERLTLADLSRVGDRREPEEAMYFI